MRGLGYAFVEVATEYATSLALVTLNENLMKNDQTARWVSCGQGVVLALSHHCYWNVMVPLFLFGNSLAILSLVLRQVLKFLPVLFYSPWLPFLS